MVQYSSNLDDDKSNKNNLLLIHLEKKGLWKFLPILKVEMNFRMLKWIYLMICQIYLNKYLYWKSLLKLYFISLLLKILFYNIRI